MVIITVRGIEVDFPYQPYDIQIGYMEKVIEALQTKSNALLESPTGTGKTLCLLCASLAWLENHLKLYPPTQFHANQNGSDFGGDDRRRKKENVRSTESPRIIYASRTHSQLAQVMQELKKTAYKRTKVSILGSRDQMCINTDVSRLPNNAAKNRACREKVKSRSCHYYNNLDEKMDQLALDPITDIEELVGFGKRNRVCPFYLSKAGEKQADLIFMPYNYIFDPTVRRTVKLDLMNAVVILDEGHNVGKVCEESYSYELTSVDLAVCIREISRILNYMVKKGDASGQPPDTAQPNNQATRNLNTDSLESPATIGDVAELKRSLLAFEKAFDAVTLSADPNSGSVKPLAFLAELFNAAGVSQQKYGMLWLTLENLTRETVEKAEEGGSGNVMSTVIAPVQKFMELLSIAFAEDAKKYHQFFRVYMRNEDVRKKAREGWNTDAITTKLSRILSVWCLSPGCTMRTIAGSGIHSMLITSGTLSPMDSLLKELMIPFQVQLSNPHIIKSSQVWMGVVGKGPDNVEWSSAYKNKDSIEYRRSLGRGIMNFLDAIPDGVLVFFSSYRAMQDCVDTWTSEGLWDGMNSKKKCFVEPTNRNDFTASLTDYFRIVKEEGKGAAFFAVCRGKISEGVDFPDCCARAVILTGLPYPAKMEPRIRVKMEYLDESFRNQETRTLNSNDWYNREAWSAINQALGRVIRHASDFGACILCDCRFEYDGSKKMLSGWLRNLARNYTFPVAKRSMSEFFRGHAGVARPVMPSSSTTSSSTSSRAKRELSPGGSSMRKCKSSCDSEMRCSQKLVFDDSALALYALPSSIPTEPSSSYEVKKASVFTAMNARALSTSALPPTVPLHTNKFSVSASHLAKPPDMTMGFISSSFASSSGTQKKLHVRAPRPFHLDTDEVTAEGEGSSQAVAGVPTGFVRVISQQSTLLDRMSSSQLPPSSATLKVSAVPSKKAVVEVRKKPTIPEIIAIMKNELQPAEFKHLNGILSDLRKPETLDCRLLTVALVGLSGERKTHRIALLLSSFIPSKFRKEYDAFLTKTGIVVSID